MKNARLLGTAAIAMMLTAFAVNNANAGDLEMTFVYDGTPPKPEPASITKDVAVCGKHNLVVESLVVNKDNKGIANIVGFVYLKRGAKIPITDAYKKTEKSKVLLDNKNCRFEPHVAVLRTTQTLLLGNKDSVGHNTKVDTFANSPINFTIPSNKSLPVNFKDTERLPSRVSCSIHPWMQAWLVIKDHPYAAVSDSSGKLVIKDLPPGKWTFQFWQEKSGYITKVKSSKGSESWSRGRVDITIKDGEKTDLGQLKLSPSLFEK